MIAQRRSQVIDCVVILTCGKTARIATSVSAVVVSSRSPIIIDVRCGRSTSVATEGRQAKRGTFWPFLHILDARGHNSTKAT